MNVLALVIAVMRRQLRLYCFCLSHRRAGDVISAAFFYNFCPEATIFRRPLSHFQLTRSFFVITTVHVRVYVFDYCRTIDLFENPFGPSCDILSIRTHFQRRKRVKYVRLRFHTPLRRISEFSV